MTHKGIKFGKAVAVSVLMAAVVVTQFSFLMICGSFPVNLTIPHSLPNSAATSYTCLLGTKRREGGTEEPAHKCPFPSPCQSIGILNLYITALFNLANTDHLNTVHLKHLSTIDVCSQLYVVHFSRTPAGVSVKSEALEKFHGHYQ